MQDRSPGWRIPQMQKSETRQEQIQGEFFHSESALPDRLVREAIQNSMDARVDDNAPVTVRFTFSGEKDALSASEAATFLRNLSPHLREGALEGIPEEPDAYFERQMPYLTIEDFGTQGLTGDIGAISTTTRGNDFWGFFRSIGISTKSEGQAGSWGLGKWVYPDASEINAFLGVTQRAGENELLLMGQAILRPHTIGDSDHRPYGWFAEFSNESDAEWLPMPVRDQAFVTQACRAFGLDRSAGNGSGPGLSIVVPFPNEELSPEALARAVVTQYFLPIVNGDLRVEILHAERDGTLITADTILEVAGSIPPSDRDDESPESMRRTVMLAQWAAQNRDLEPRKLDASKDSFEMSDEDKERFEREDRLVFELDIDTTRRQENTRENSSFTVIVEKDDNLENGFDYFVRGFLRVPRMDHVGGFRARALVLVDGQSGLGHMLRDAEGPAHMVWNPNERRVTQRWVGAPARVTRVRNVARRILQALTTRPSTLQRHALADLFPSPSSSAGNDPGPGRKPGDNTPRLPGPIPGGQSPFVISQSANGFSVTKNPRSSKQVIGAWRLRMAYDVSRGNPFRAFETAASNGLLDFTIFDEGALSVSLRKVKTNPIADNVLDFDVQDDEFRLQISGFDGRDVTVDIAAVPNREEVDPS